MDLRFKYFQSSSVGQWGRWLSFKMAATQGNERQREEEEQARNIKPHFVGFKTVLCTMFWGNIHQSVKAGFDTQ